MHKYIFTVQDRKLFYGLFYLKNINYRGRKFKNMHRYGKHSFFSSIQLQCSVDMEIYFFRTNLLI
jgi:hypothetical protein